MKHWMTLCKEYGSQVVSVDDNDVYNVCNIHVASPHNITLNLMRTMIKEYIQHEKNDSESGENYPSTLPMQDVERQITEFQEPEAKPLTPPPEPSSRVMSKTEIQSKYYGGPPMSKEAIRHKYYSDVVRGRDKHQGETLWFTSESEASDDEDVMPKPKRGLKPKHITKPANHIKILKEAYSYGPYPSRKCVIWVQKETGLKYGQIRNWFYGERVRQGDRAIKQ